MLLLYLEEGRQLVNSHCEGLEPWQIIGATFITTLGALWIKGLLFQRESNYSQMMHVYNVGLLDPSQRLYCTKVSLFKWFCEEPVSFRGCIQKAF